MSEAIVSSNIKKQHDDQFLTDNCHTNFEFLPCLQSISHDPQTNGSGLWKLNCQKVIQPARRWYSGEHSCLPSSWSGFDSRPTQFCFCLIFCFALCLLPVWEKPVTWRERARTTRLQRSNNKTIMPNKQEAINFICWKRSAQMHVFSKQPIPCE